jgi:hypothetical protein
VVVLKLSELPPGDSTGEKPEHTWIPRETWRQEKAVVFVRDAIVGPHMFLALDRSRAKSPKEHLWQARRGVRKGTPDTQLILPGGRHIWFEFKADGQKVVAGDDQDLMLQALRDLGDAAAWGVTIEDLRLFYLAEGVPLVANAYYRALVLDGLVDSRIAKAEGRVPVVAKKPRPPRAGPRSTASRGFVKRAAARGIRF